MTLSAHYGYTSAIRRLPLIVTQSDLSSFRGCRRAWFLGSYLGLNLKAAPVVGPLTLGTRVHKALEVYYTDGRHPEEVYNEVAAAELEKLIESGVFFDRAAWESETDLGRIMLEGYLEWLEETGADSDYEILGAEKRLIYPLEIWGVEIELRGKVDIRMRNIVTGARVVVDNKTTAHFSNLTVTSPYNTQLKTYMLLERLAEPESAADWVSGAMFNMLRKVKRGVNSRPPYYDRLEVHFNDHMLRNFFKQIQGVLHDYVRVVTELDAGGDDQVLAYPSPGAGCRYCPFKMPCLAMDDGSRAGDMLASLYDQYDPHARYDEEPATFSDELSIP